MPAAVWDEANDLIPASEISEAWVEFELECERWRVPVSVSRDDLERLVEASTEVLEREQHRLVHSSDFVRWGRRGGLTTLRRYGVEHFRWMARVRWSR